MSELVTKIKVRLEVKSYDPKAGTAVVEFSSANGDPEVSVKTKPGGGTPYLSFPKRAKKKGEVDFDLHGPIAPSGKFWQFDTDPSKGPRFLNQTGVDDLVAFKKREILSPFSTLSCQYHFPIIDKQTWNLKFSIIDPDSNKSLTVDPEIENDNT